jgi:hypothetical protein
VPIHIQTHPHILSTRRYCFCACKFDYNILIVYFLHLYLLYDVSIVGIGTGYEMMNGDVRYVFENGGGKMNHLLVHRPQQITLFALWIVLTHSSSYIATLAIAPPSPPLSMTHCTYHYIQ